MSEERWEISAWHPGMTDTLKGRGKNLQEAAKNLEEALAYHSSMANIKLKSTNKLIKDLHNFTKGNA